MALEALECCGSESYTVDSVVYVEFQKVVYCLHLLVGMWLLFVHMCVRGRVKWGGGEEESLCSRVSLGNEDDYAALGGGEERQQPQGGRGEENMCL